MNKYLSIDLGSKTLGLATSQGVVASPSLTLKFEEWNFEQAKEKLLDYLWKNPCEKIIIGYPKNMDGSIGERAEMIDYFIELFLADNPRFEASDIIKVDERRTTKMARQIMIEANLSREQQKQKKDSLAAQLILEQYLNSIN
ncbi:putative pre-16S rRNA nuclease [Mesoplasma sp. JKS002657]|nr:MULTISPECIES: Holliday junction resolvase RuvX [unclassified Mesoplasma]MCL8213045.1 putative pre-16S rRNA nuclease [Mesoplasma sp. JKS002661]MCL8216306.1 putative pre-16S rRNA nuclease [Mesoplasma sp. JKS002657]